MTLNKIYRAFPELDEFPDEECQRWVEAAQRRVQWVIVICVVPIFVIGAVVAVVFMDWFTWMLWARYTTRLPMLLFTLLWIGLPILFGTIPSFLMRDVLIRSTIRRLVMRAQCADCGFSLLGLPTFETSGGESVRCPECGVVRTLKYLELTREQLLSGVRPPGTPDAA